MTGASEPLDAAAVAVDDALLDALAEGVDLGAGDWLVRRLAAWRDTARAGTPDLPRRPARFVRARGAAEGSDPPATPDPRSASVYGRAPHERGPSVDAPTTPQTAPAVTHDVPVGPHGLTACCGRRADELPDDARLAEDESLVTCDGETDDDGAADDGVR